MASPAEDFTLGIEEEYFLVDAATRALGRGSEAVIDRAREAVGNQADHELQLSQVESVTPVCRTLAEVRGHLSRIRRELAAAAEAEARRLVASGSHPFSHWVLSPVFPSGLCRPHRRAPGGHHCTSHCRGGRAPRRRPSSRAGQPGRGRGRRSARGLSGAGAEGHACQQLLGWVAGRAAADLASLAVGEEVTAG